MLRSRTTTLPSKDLLSPSTSIAMLVLPASVPRMTKACGRVQADGNRLADAEVLRLLGTRLDTEHETCPLFAAVDDGWRKLGLRRNEGDARHQLRLAAVTVDFEAIIDFQGRQGRLRHEKAHLDIVRRLQGDDRPTGLHHFPDAEVDLLHATLHRTCDPTPLQARAR